MPRPLRVEYSGAIYHLMNRGDRREEIFKDDLDRRRFLSTLAETCGKTKWQVHAYCLMANHFHLVIETPMPNLVAGMKWLLGVYTQRFNSRHKLCGHLFAGRYKAVVVDGSGDGYLGTVCDYVHLNPFRAGLLPDDAGLQSFKWSSYGEYLRNPARRPAWLRVDRLFGEKGIFKDSAAGRREFAAQMEQRRKNDEGKDYVAARRGWLFGSDAFREDLLAVAAEHVGPSHYGITRSESDEEMARRLLSRELKRLGWKKDDLRKRRKGDKVKVALAHRLREETTMSLKWIAEHLEMGSWTYVANLIRQPLKKESQKYK